MTHTEKMGRNEKRYKSLCNAYVHARYIAMASNGDEIREAAAVGRRLLERYGDDWWEAQVVRKVDTGIDIEFTKKNRGRTWKSFIEWSELAEDADLPEVEQTYRWLPVVSPGYVQRNPGVVASASGGTDNKNALPPPPPSQTPPASPKAGCGLSNTKRQIDLGSRERCSTHYFITSDFFL